MPSLFYASQCPFCKSFLSIFEKYARKDDFIDSQRIEIGNETSPVRIKFCIEVGSTIIFSNTGRVITRLDGILVWELSGQQLKDFLLSYVESELRPSPNFK